MPSRTLGNPTADHARLSVQMICFILVPAAQMVSVLLPRTQSLRREAKPNIKRAEVQSETRCALSIEKINSAESHP